jgi:hypothetical protein
LRTGLAAGVSSSSRSALSSVVDDMVLLMVSHGCPIIT